MKQQPYRLILTCLVLVTWLVPNDRASAGPAKEILRRGEVSDCGSVRSASNLLNDYRSYHTDPQLIWSIGDINRNHYDVAKDRMRQGEFSQRVLADLDYTLWRWPNHHPALQAVVEYELGGGASHEFLTVGCYFSRAREFSPDDVSVLSIEAQYYWRQGAKEVALDILKECLEFWPESIDLHYNLALIYFELQDYDRSMQHARLAYAGGHPLLGLRKKLEGSGHWTSLEE